MPMHPARCALLLALFSLGCQQAPEDFLFAFGTVEATDGTPTRGTVTFLRRDCELADCHPFVVDTSAQFFAFAEVETDEDGQWMLELTRFDATIYSRSGTTARTFKAVVQTDPGLPPVEATYSHDEGDVDLPPLRQWDPRAVVELSADGASLHVGTSAAPPIPAQNMAEIDLLDFPFETERTGRYGIALLDADEQEVWFHPATGEVEAWPLELLQDFVSRWQILAFHEGPWFAPSLLAGQTHSRVEQRFPIQELPAFEPRIPLSRGETCTLLDADLQPLETLAPCPVTDGRLEVGSYRSMVSAVEVTLETPTRLTRVSVLEAKAKAGASLRVEAFDGVGWHPIAEEALPPIDEPPPPEDPNPFWPGVRIGHADVSFVVDVPPGLGPVQAVRVRAVGAAGEGLWLSSTAEVGLFGG